MTHFLHFTTSSLTGTPYCIPSCSSQLRALGSMFRMDQAPHKALPNSHCPLLTPRYALAPAHHPLSISHYPLLSSDYSVATTHHSPLTTHHSPLTTHYSLLTTHYPLPTTHYSPFTTHYSLLSTHCSLLTTRHSLRAASCRFEIVNVSEAMRQILHSIEEEQGHLRASSLLSEAVRASSHFCSTPLGHAFKACSRTWLRPALHRQRVLWSIAIVHPERLVSSTWARDTGPMCVCCGAGGSAGGDDVKAGECDCAA